MGGSNFTLIPIDVLGILLYILYLFLSKEVKFKFFSVIKRVSVALVCIVSLNLYWLWSVIYHFRYVWVAGVSVETPSLLNGHTSYSEIWRSLGLWSLYASDTDGTPYVIFAPSYQNSLLSIAATYILPIILIIALARNPLKIKYFLMALVLLTLPLIAGEYPVNSPLFFGNIFKWLYDHILQFDIFRETFKFTMLLDLALAFGLSLFVSLISARWKSKALGFKIFTYLGFAVIIGISSWPFFSGQLFEQTRIFPSVPDYWKALNSCYSADADPVRSASRTLLTPGQFFTVYSWGQVEGETAQPSLQVPVITQVAENEPTQSPQELRNDIFDAINGGNIASFNALLQVYDISYVLQRDDLLVSASPLSQSQQVMHSFLDSDKQLTQVCNKGPLYLYKLNQPPVHRGVYVAASTSLLATTGDLVNLNPETLNQNRVFFFKDRQLNSTDTQLKNAGIDIGAAVGAKGIIENDTYQEPPAIQINKSSATEYLVTVNSVNTNPFWLVLPQAYNPDWIAQFSDNGNKIADSNHIMINGYANGWKINRAGTYQIKILYVPQLVYQGGMLVSAISGILMIFIVLLQKFFGLKKFGRNRKKNTQETTEKEKVAEVVEESVQVLKL
jgi:hypothetical protein